MDAPRSMLFLTQALNLGGVATYMSTLGQGLIRRGVKVSVVARLLDEGTTFGCEYFRGLGFDVHQCEFPGYGLNLTNARTALRSIRRLKEVVRDTAADVLHVQAPTLCLAARFAGRPFVTTFNISVTGRNKLRIARWANRLTERPFGSTAIAISTEMRQELIDDLGIPAHRVRKLTYTIDDSKFTPATPEQRLAARRKFGVPDDGVVVSMVASLEPRKNHAMLLDAIKLLRDRGRPLPVLLAGSGWGDLDQQLLAAIAGRGLGDLVRYLGQQPAVDVYHASDIHVLPSLQEGFALVSVEAMLCGLVPIRTPSAGTIDQIADGRTGFVVPFGQPQVLADRLQQLVDDPAKRQQMAAAAREFAADAFRAERMVEETLAVYRDAMAEG